MSRHTWKTSKDSPLIAYANIDGGNKTRLTFRLDSSHYAFKKQGDRTFIDVKSDGVVFRCYADTWNKRDFLLYKEVQGLISLYADYRDTGLNGTVFCRLVSVSKQHSKLQEKFNTERRQRAVDALMEETAEAAPPTPPAPKVEMVAVKDLAPQPRKSTSGVIKAPELLAEDAHQLCVPGFSESEWKYVRAFKDAYKLPGQKDHAFTRAWILTKMREFDLQNGRLAETLLRSDSSSNSAKEVVNVTQ
jgi:hypothetical protein